MFKSLKNTQFLTWRIPCFRKAGRGILLFIAVLLMLGCDKRELEHDIADVYKVLEQRKEAIDNQNLKQFDAILFADYQDAGISRKDVMEYMSMVFERYENISYSYQKIRPDVKMNTARVVHNIEYNFNHGEKFYRTQEIVIFRWYEGRWTISGGVKLGFL
ncbi:MAG: hypothetical protein GXP14_01555 [Gammaproteobacteria bacterium]|nr:hypothetical protein [Gammaproteobacteria bacterium]